MTHISRKTIARVFLYIRTLDTLIRQKRNLISSKELARIVGVTDAQIRKDISNFARIGRPGIGYNTQELKDTLEEFVLQHNCVKLVLFGVGNLGTAILQYPGFQKNKIKIIAAFEKKEEKIGSVINGVRVYAAKDAPRIIAQKKADIGIIAVPERASQEVADMLVLSGLKGIVNFAPTTIAVPRNVMVKDIDFSIEFLSLFCNACM
ncbi:MAG: redox-sensing transcriptional repressor Rex [Candidatus Omnitrophica bacterium]|nr:redox-sensing transcriptional repressor Rex [Candidatus Omnitrophota bacterium]